MPGAGRQHPYSVALAYAGGLASAWLLLAIYRRLQRQQRIQKMAGYAGSEEVEQHEEEEEEEEEEEDVPEEFLDPITFACMADPVLLCGTGQVYCLRSLRTWLATGTRKCPKTNMSMRDIQVVRLPSMRSRIAAWRAMHSMPPLPPLDPPAEVVQAAGPEMSRLIGELRCGDAYQRGLAAGRLNDLLIEWGPAPTPAQRQVMEAVLLDLVWLLRQGDPFGSGVAAAALAQYQEPEQVAFLAAVAAMPAVALLWSPHSYGQHSAARLLSNLARSGRGMPYVLVEAGAVRGLLQQLDLRQPFPYSRCSAAAALTELCASEHGQEEVRAGGGIALLKAVVLQQEAAGTAATDGPGDEVLLRFDKRDAATCLLALQLTEEEAGQEPAVGHVTLLALSHCSAAWLQGRAAGPTEGYSAEELGGGLARLALGEAEEDEQEEGEEDDDDDEDDDEEEEEEEEEEGGGGRG